MQYRPEIDGLRTIAVLSVLFFHFGFKAISGGFVGVDVFFVISGYLITSILLEEISAQEFSFVHFYDKRMRRLFPALFAVIATSFVAAYFIFMPDEFKEFAQSAVATSVYLSNFFFWLKSDYFAGPSELKPLLHTWSLAIEEQFYFVFPLFLLFCMKFFRRYILHIILLLLGLSFVSGFFVLRQDPTSAFFLSPLRFWELLAGSALAYLHFKKYFQANAHTLYLSIIGLLLILVPLFLFNKGTNFPGVSALSPVIGTMLIISDTSKRGLVFHILSSRFFVYVGKISYSLYLWHWPIIVFYGYWIIRPFEIIDQFIMILATLMLSLLSYYLIEKPFRKPASQNSFGKASVFTVVISGVFIAFGLFISSKQGMPERFPSSLVVAENYQEQREVINPCFLKREQTIQDWNKDNCTFGKEDAVKTIVLWGDSHANHLLYGIKSNQQNINKKIIMFANAGCPALLSGTVKDRPNCIENNKAFLKFLLDENISRLYVAASWHYSLNESGVKIQDLLSTFKMFEEAGLRTTIVNQLPIYSISNPDYLLFRLNNKTESYENYELRPANGLDTAKLISDTFVDYEIVNLQDAFCSNSGKCKIYRKEEMMVADQAHLSKAGSTVAIQYLLPYFNR